MYVDEIDIRLEIFFLLPLWWKGGGKSPLYLHGNKVWKERLKGRMVGYKRRRGMERKWRLRSTR